MIHSLQGIRVWIVTLTGFVPKMAQSLHIEIPAAARFSDTENGGAASLLADLHGMCARVPHYFWMQVLRVPLSTVRETVDPSGTSVPENGLWISTSPGLMHSLE